MSLIDRYVREVGRYLPSKLKADVERATVDLARARLAFGKRQVDRNEDLYRKKLISVHDRDEMRHPASRF